MVVQMFHDSIYEAIIGCAFKKKRQKAESHNTNLLFIHRSANIMRAMKNIFFLSQKQVCLFSFLPKCQHLFDLGTLATQTAFH